jgi:hypothetical protein
MARRWDGREYRVDDHQGAGLLVASDARLWRELTAELNLPIR